VLLDLQAHAVTSLFPLLLEMALAFVLGMEEQRKTRAAPWKFSLGRLKEFLQTSIHLFAAEVLRVESNRLNSSATNTSHIAPLRREFTVAMPVVLFPSIADLIHALVTI